MPVAAAEPPAAGEDPRRHIPRTDQLLADPALASLAERHGPALVKAAIGAAQEQARRADLAPHAVRDRAVELAHTPEFAPSSQRVALNATGIVVHTNLGRAPLSAAALDAVTAAAGYVDLEFDVATGGRGIRGRGANAAVLAGCPAAQAALVVNNGAAALSLAVTALAGRMASGMAGAMAGAMAGGATGTVLVSRGEMVEIGDGFRLPDLIEATGVRIVEVGTTNRTRRSDYEAALGPGVGAILKIHPSNFVVAGFTAQASVAELAEVARSHDVPLVVDIGSGLLAADPALPDEPDATSALQAGADLVTCSGDKLLGGPQAGLILGRADLVQRLRRHPLHRAFRADKLALAALEATLRGPEPPVTTYRRRSGTELRRLAEALAAEVSARVGDRIPVRIVPAEGRIGGGGAPGVPLPGWAVALPANYGPELRRGDPLVVARVVDGYCLLDCRCLEQAQLPQVVEAVAAAERRLGADR